MDFLDPRKKRSRKLRLIISYALMASLAITAALIFVYSSFGYGINTKTGKIVQNGLVFVDSLPSKGEIYLNGQDANKQTSARLVLPEDIYTLSIKADGYRDWDASFKLGAQSVLRLDYALMIPTALHPSTFDSSNASILASSQSPDGKWIAELVNGSTLELLTYSNGFSAMQVHALPPSLAKLSGTGSWQVVGWSPNRNLILVSHQVDKQIEYLVFNRSAPNSSINLSSLTGAIAEARWLPGSNSQLYVLKNSSVLRYDLSSGQLSLQFGGASSFEALSANRLIFASTAGTAASVKLWDGSKTYQLSPLQLSSGGQVLLAADSYQGHEYYAAGTSSQDKINVYKDPLDSLRASSSVSPAPARVLKINQPSQLVFSPGGRILMAESGQSVTTYNLEYQASAEFAEKYALSTPLAWVDDYRLGGLSKSSVAVVSDYNGANQQLLMKSDLPAGFYIDPNDKWMFSYLDSAHPKFQITSLIAN